MSQFYAQFGPLISHLVYWLFIAMPVSCGGAIFGHAIKEEKGASLGFTLAFALAGGLWMYLMLRL